MLEVLSTMPPPAPRRGPQIDTLVVVSRLIKVPIDEISPALGGDRTTGRATAPIALDGAGSLALMTPFTWAERTRTWRGRGRLYGRGLRLARFTRVEIEVSAWSNEASHVALRPLARSPHTWGLRRLRRYLDLAHRAVDELERTLRRPIAVPLQPVPCAPDEPCAEPQAA
jgi:hypothetical protein